MPNPWRKILSFVRVFPSIEPNPAHDPAPLSPLLVYLRFLNVLKSAGKRGPAIGRWSYISEGRGPPPSCTTWWILLTRAFEFLCSLETTDHIIGPSACRACCILFEIINWVSDMSQSQIPPNLIMMAFHVIIT